MKATKISLLLFFTISMFCYTISHAQEKKGEFKIEVIQNGKRIKLKKGKFKLKKEAFKFRITLTDTDHVYVSSSWGTYYYNYPDSQNIFECNDKDFLKGCRFVAIKTGNEDKFNVDKDIYVGDGSYQSVWFYTESSPWHRFDKGVKIENGVITAEITVENIFDLDKRDEGKYEENEYSFPINKIDKNIYMVFATRFYEKGMEHPDELQRYKFILEFK